jgi:hypothetical protein
MPSQLVVAVVVSMVVETSQAVEQVVLLGAGLLQHLLASLVLVAQQLQMVTTRDTATLLLAVVVAELLAQVAGMLVLVRQIIGEYLVVLLETLEEMALVVVAVQVQML